MLVHNVQIVLEVDILVYSLDKSELWYSVTSMQYNDVAFSDPHPKHKLRAMCRSSSYHQSHPSSSALWKDGRVYAVY